MSPMVGASLSRHAGSQEDQEEDNQEEDEIGDSSRPQGQNWLSKFDTFDT
jgi:hypothetical protein